MKLTQNDIAIIEELRNKLMKESIMVDGSIPEFNSRMLVSKIKGKMDDANDTLFVLSKKEMQEAYKNPEKLKEFAKEAFYPELEVGKWYRSENSHGQVEHIFITEIVDKSTFKCYGFNIEGNFISENLCDILRDDNFSESEGYIIHRLFKNEAFRRGYPDGNQVHKTLHTDGCKYYINEKLVFNNGIWLDENTDINNLVKEAKKLEQKHGLKITLTFE